MRFSIIPILLCLFSGINWAQRTQALYISNQAELVFSFRPAWVWQQAKGDIWRQQIWLQRGVVALQRDLFGKRLEEEIWALTLGGGSAAAGIDTSGYWHLVSSRDEVGIARYSLIMPMQNITVWRTFAQKSLPLYADTELRVTGKGVFYIQREQYLLAWNREHICLSWYILPNDGVFNPTFVQRRQYSEEQLVPALKPEKNLSVDSFWLEKLEKAAAHSSENAPFFLRLQGRVFQLSALAPLPHWSLLYLPRGNADAVHYARVLQLPAIAIKLPRWAGRYGAVRDLLAGSSSVLKLKIEKNGSLRLWFDKIATTEQWLSVFGTLYKTW